MPFGDVTIWYQSKGLTKGTEDGTSRKCRWDPEVSGPGSTGRAQLEGHSRGYDGDPEMFPGGGDPGRVDPMLETKVGVE